MASGQRLHQRRKSVGQRQLLHPTLHIRKVAAVRNDSFQSRPCSFLRPRAAECQGKGLTWHLHTVWRSRVDSFEACNRVIEDVGSEILLIHVYSGPIPFDKSGADRREMIAEMLSPNVT